MCLRLKHVALRDLTVEGLLELSRRGHLFLDLAEMQAVQNYFRSAGREPTDAELETLAQTWSEHCVHKTMKARVEFTQGAEVSVIENLVKDTVFKATMDLNKPWAISVFKDNAGVVEFDEENAVCMKVETHNRPSAIEPYGGAATRHRRLHPRRHRHRPRRTPFRQHRHFLFCRSNHGSGRIAERGDSSASDDAARRCRRARLWESHGDTDGERGGVFR